MWGLIRHILMLWLTSLVAVGIFILIGAQQPTPESVKLIHLDICKPPCWLGIEPGKTLLDEAQLIVERVYSPHYDLRIDAGDYYFDAYVRNHHSEPQLLWVRVGYSVPGSQVVDFINVSYTFNSEQILSLPTFADLYNLLGSPQLLEVKGGFSYSAFYGCHRRGMVMAVMTDTHLRFGEPLTYLQFYGRNSGHLGYAVPWGGFVTVQKAEQYIRQYGPRSYDQC